MERGGVVSGLWWNVREGRNAYGMGGEETERRIEDGGPDDGSELI